MNISISIANDDRKLGYCIGKLPDTFSKEEYLGLLRNMLGQIYGEELRRLSEEEDAVLPASRR